MAEWIYALSLLWSTNGFISKSQRSQLSNDNLSCYRLCEFCNIHSKWYMQWQNVLFSCKSSISDILISISNYVWSFHTNPVAYFNYATVMNWSHSCVNFLTSVSHSSWRHFHFLCMHCNCSFFNNSRCWCCCSSCLLFFQVVAVVIAFHHIYYSIFTRPMMLLRSWPIPIALSLCLSSVCHFLYCCFTVHEKPVM